MTRGKLWRAAAYLLTVGVSTAASYGYGIHLHEQGHRQVLQRIGCTTETTTVNGSVAVTSSCPDSLPDQRVREARIATYSYDSSETAIPGLFLIAGFAAGNTLFLAGREVVAG